MGGGIITKTLSIKIIFIGLFILFCGGVVFSQETSVSNAVSSKEQELEMVISTNEEIQEQQTRSTGWLFVRMVLVLLLVVACVYGVFYFVKKNTNTDNQTDAFLKKVASINLAPGKSVQVVTIQNHCYVLGVSDSSVQLISELDDKDLIDAMNLKADSEPTGKVKDFATMLANAMGVKKKSFEDSVSTSVQNMKTQSDRLKRSSLMEKNDEE